MNFKSFAIGALLSISALFGAGPLRAESELPLLVALDNGQIEGTTLASGVRAWLGIPFAAPPVRALRWKAPQPVQNWNGVYHADRAAPMCLQSGRGRTMNHYFGTEATSEDCLYLNVWAPPHKQLKSGKKLPVIVWIYGGGFTVGSANMANYSGEGLAEKGVVRVNIAYRVGPMGFLAHPELTKEGGGHSGNYGLMDQVAALEWVQRNIAAFGGDAGNVTIMGQSAGSMSVSLLQIDQRAKGLFHKIVGMSGSVHGGQMGPVPLNKGEAAGIALQEKLAATSVESMRDISGDRILAASPVTPGNAIVVDGAHITGSAAESYAVAKQHDVPIMVGFTRDERFANLGPANNVAEYEAVVRTAFPVNAEKILKAYPVKDDAAVQRALVDLMRDMSVGRQMYLWAAASGHQGKAPAYGYYFTRRQPYSEGIRFADHDPATVGAYHTGEVPYFLRTLDSLNLFRKTRDWSDDDRALSDKMSAAILQFAQSGNPGWTAFDAKKPKLMRFDFRGNIIDWPNAKALALLAEGKSSPPPPPVSGRIRD